MNRLLFGDNLRWLQDTKLFPDACVDLVYLGDWTSYYVALDNDVDPGPIDAIMQLKAALG